MTSIQSPISSIFTTLVDASGTLSLGAHLISARRGYVHHGIYVGEDRVIHYGGFHRPGDRRPIESVSLACFSAGHGFQMIDEPQTPYTGSQVAARAFSRLGENRYSLFFNNCEHFCEWCIHGIARSDQVRRTILNPWRLIQVLCAMGQIAFDSLDMFDLKVGADPCHRRYRIPRAAKPA